MLIGMLVNPFSSPPTTYITDPMITTIASTVVRKTRIFRRLARMASIHVSFVEVCAELEHLCE
jgi:hypothetical protein